MSYAIIIWMTEHERYLETGTVYGWYEALATALNTAVNLRQSGRYFDAVVVKMV